MRCWGRVVLVPSSQAEALYWSPAARQLPFTQAAWIQVQPDWKCGRQASGQVGKG